MAILEILATVSDTTDNAVSPPLAMIILSGLALVTCLIIVIVLFNWVRKLQVEGALKNTIVRGISRMELDRLKRELDAKTWMGPLGPVEKPFPQEAIAVGLLHDLYLKPWERGNQMVLSKEPVLQDYGENEREKCESDEMEWRNKKTGVEKFLEWEKKENEIYHQRLQNLTKEADFRAKEIVPESMDTSVLGTGFSFLLEFSTVIVIIFAIIALGILGILEGREIATILAAIAGYVLGKASGWPTKSETKEQT